MSANLYSKGGAESLDSEGRVSETQQAGGIKVLTMNRQVYDPAAFPFDVVNGLSKQHRYRSYASANRIMDAAEGSDYQKRMYERMDVTGSDGLYMACFNGIVDGYIMNSGSVLNPDRAEFFVDELGLEEEVTVRRVYNFFAVVVDILRRDLRRFFRQYSEAVRARMKYWLARRGKTDPQTVLMLNVIDQIAHERGLSRYPELIPDCMDKGNIGLTVAERSALGMAKVTYLSGLENEADAPKVLQVAAEARRSMAKSTSAAPQSPGALLY